VSGLTPIPSEVVKPPRIAECPTHIECRIVDTLETGDHTIFIGEVVAKSGDFDAIKDGKLNARIEPLFHLGGTKFICGGERMDVNELRRSEKSF
jgi:flavin reductase (DIM6/NTAB) family NADH-FMN oxidoreductase RutF